VAAYVGLVYATIPFAPRLWLGLSRLTGIELRPLALTILLCGGALAVLPVLLRPRVRSLLAMTAVGVVYVAIYRLPFEAPAERLHLLEYGVVPGLVAWALGPRRSLTTRLVLGAIAGGIAGVGDELIQGLSPRRVFQVADIVLNGTSAALGAMAWGAMLSPWRAPAGPGEALTAMGDPPRG
jgi:hypothetical protein